MDLSLVVAQMPLFAGLAPEVLEHLTSLVERQSLSSGQVLYAEGDPPRDFCVVASGRLRVSSRGALIGYVARLEPVGEMGIITGEPRTATVHAIRDSVLLRIPRERFLRFLHRHPEALMSLSCLMLARLRQSQRQQRMAWTGTERTFAVIPATGGLPVNALARGLLRQLSGWPRARLIGAAQTDAALGRGAAQTPFDDSADNGQLMGWLNELEDHHRYVLFAADSDRGAWALRCMRQADRVLVLAAADAVAANPPVLAEARALGLLPPVELVLLRAESDPAPHTLAWREATGARAHYFVHPWHPPELAALARQTTGRGLGLVLGGGGARGFAHIGLVRALEQLEIPVDVMGGTSMGAFVAAMLACGYDSVEMAHIARETFLKNNFLNDYVLPRVSLIRGSRFLVRLREIFGERRIEELRRTYFCVSSNLSTGATVVHESGELAAWVGCSMAVPGVVPPIAYQGELLCDGGVVDNLPTDIMQSLERGAIIACSVSSEGEFLAPGAGLGKPDNEALLRWSGTSRRPNLREIISRSATLTADTKGLRQAAERADHYIRMPVQGFAMLDWQRLDELIERGYEHALQQLTPLRDTLLR